MLCKKKSLFSVPLLFLRIVWSVITDFMQEWTYRWIHVDVVAEPAGRRLCQIHITEAAVPRTELGQSLDHAHPGRYKSGAVIPITPTEETGPLNPHDQLKSL